MWICKPHYITLLSRRRFFWVKIPLDESDWIFLRGPPSCASPSGLHRQKKTLWLTLWREIEEAQLQFVSSQEPCIFTQFRIDQIRYQISFRRFINKLFAYVRYESIKFPKPLKNGHCGAQRGCMNFALLRLNETKLLQRKATIQKRYFFTPSFKFLKGLLKKGEGEQGQSGRESSILWFSSLRYFFSRGQWRSEEEYHYYRDKAQNHKAQMLRLWICNIYIKEPEQVLPSSRCRPCKFDPPLKRDRRKLMQRNRKRTPERRRRKQWNGMTMARGGAEESATTTMDSATSTR